jgi:hypothetical protein
MRNVMPSGTDSSAWSAVRAWQTSDRSRSSMGTSDTTAVRARNQNETPMPACRTPPPDACRIQAVGAPRRWCRKKVRVMSATGLSPGIGTVYRHGDDNTL